MPGDHPVREIAAVLDLSWVPSVGKTSTLTRSGTFTFVRRAKFLPPRVSCLTMGRHYTTELRHTIAAAASLRRSAVHSRRCAEPSAASMRRPVTWRGRWPRPKHSNARAAIRKRVEMLFAHLKRIFRLGRLRLRGPSGAQFEFMLAAIAQNLSQARKARRPTTASHRGVLCIRSAEFSGSDVRPSLVREWMPCG